MMMSGTEITLVKSPSVNKTTPNISVDAAMYACTVGNGIPIDSNHIAVEVISDHLSIAGS